MYLSSDCTRLPSDTISFEDPLASDGIDTLFQAMGLRLYVAPSAGVSQNGAQDLIRTVH